jgi:hypothetical protein
MSRERDRKSHALAWGISISTVLVLYLIGYGLVYGMTVNGSFTEHPDWLIILYRPMAWLHNHTILEKPLEAYCAWWGEILK